jgi:cytochrome c
MKRIPVFCAIVAALLLNAPSARAQLAGHGGPVRSIAISADGNTIISGSFDTAAIRWSLASGSAEQVLRFHDDAVNVVAFLRDGRMATAGADGKIALWTAGRQQPDEILEGHTAPIVALAVSLDGTMLASAAWDGTARLWPLAGGAKRVLEGHSQNVNGVAFSPDSKSLISVSYDLTVRIWALSAGQPDIIITLPVPLNAVAVAPDGEIVIGGADGKVRFRSAGAENLGEVQAGTTPIIALAISPDGARIAAAGIGGTVNLIDRKTGSVVSTLVGPGLPVWSVAFTPDGATLLTGGADATIRRWNAQTGNPVGSPQQGAPGDPLAAYAGDHGAEVFRACVACHTLSEKDGPRAGPTLAGLFGRKIASLPGYRFSDALKNMNIVWTPETVSQLFDVGPNAYTPGTKMPEQRIGSPDDRKALTDFLGRVTAK